MRTSLLLFSGALLLGLAGCRHTGADAQVKGEIGPSTEAVTGMFQKAVYGYDVEGLGKACIYYLMDGAGKVYGLYNEDVDHCNESGFDPNAELQGKALRFEQVYSIADSSLMASLRMLNPGIADTEPNAINYLHFNGGYTEMAGSPFAPIAGQFMKAIYGQGVGELDSACIFYVKDASGKVHGLYSSDMDYCSESGSDPNRDLKGKTLRFAHVFQIHDHNVLKYLRYEFNAGLPGVDDKSINYVAFNVGYDVK